MPDRSTFSKNRYGPFADADVLRRVFELVVERCAGFGVVGVTDAVVDGSIIEADANRDHREKPERVENIWAQKDEITRPVQAYLDQLAEDAVTPNDGPDSKPPKYISETDPKAGWSLKDGPGRFSSETNYLVDTDHGIIVDVEATPARNSQEIVAAKILMDRSADRYGFQPDVLAADGSYATGRFLAWLLQREIAPDVPVLDRKHQTGGKLEQSYFEYDVENDRYLCPEGKALTRR